MALFKIDVDKDFFKAYNDASSSNYQLAQKVYWSVIERMVKTGEPGFSVNYKNKNESLRNACTEIVSEDDCDVCCLGSINLDQIETIEELKRVTTLGQLFLICGILYSDVPYEKVLDVRKKNMRTGLGLMGLHSWLIMRGYPYDQNDELEKWLKVWKKESDDSARIWSDILSVNEPIAKRGIAPNGSISIAGGMTTGGIEPVYSVAFQRRYLTPDGWKKQYVVDFVAEKMHELGIDVNSIEDAYSLSLDVERRIRFQSFIQKYVDNSISSTINLPAFGSAGNDDYVSFGNTLMEYLPTLRGITVYPNGARGGQPLTPIDFNYAVSKKGVVFEGNEDCADGVCGL